METKYYQHVERLNSDEVDGICTVSPNNRYLLVVTEKGILNKIEPVALPTSSRAKAGNRVIQLSRGDSIKYINGITPDQAIRKAFKWCLNRGLITNPTYIK